MKSSTPVEFRQIQRLSKFHVFQNKLLNRGTSDNVAPGGRASGLPRGKLPGCMKAALLAGWMGNRLGGGGVVTHPLPIQTNKK